MDGYFSTPEQQKAKQWDMLEERKSLKSTMALLRNEMRTLSQTGQDFWKSVATPSISLNFDKPGKVAVNQRHMEDVVPGFTIPSDEIFNGPTAIFSQQVISSLFDQYESKRRSLALLEAEIKDF